MDISLLLVVLVIASVLAIGLVLVPYLKRKGLVNQDDIKTTGQLLAIVQLIVSEIKFKDKEIKDEIVIVVQVSNIAVGYVSEMMNDLSLEDKKKSAIAATIHALNTLNIDITDERKQIIENTINMLVK